MPFQLVGGQGGRNNYKASIRHLGPRRKGAGWVFAPDLTTQFCGAMLEAQALDRTISKHAGPKTTACSCVARARPGTELTRGTNEEQIVGTPMLVQELSPPGCACASKLSSVRTSRCEEREREEGPTHAQPRRPINCVRVRGPRTQC